MICVSMVSFAERIREYRTQMDKTQKEVADMLGITMQNISNWEHGKNSPQLNDIEEIAIKLGVNPCWLFGYTGVPMVTSNKELNDLMSEKLIDQTTMDNAPQQAVNGSMYPVYTKEQLDKRMAMLAKAIDMFDDKKIDSDMLKLIVESLR